MSSEGGGGERGGEVRLGSRGMVWFFFSNWRALVRGVGAILAMGVEIFYGVRVLCGVIVY